MFFRPIQNTRQRIRARFSLYAIYCIFHQKCFNNNPLLILFVVFKIKNFNTFSNLIFVIVLLVRDCRSRKLPRNDTVSANTVR